jgi:hypothetical protein
MSGGRVVEVLFGFDTGLVRQPPLLLTTFPATAYRVVWVYFESRGVSHYIDDAITSSSLPNIILTPRAGADRQCCGYWADPRVLRAARRAQKSQPSRYTSPHLVGYSSTHQQSLVGQMTMSLLIGSTG